MYKKGDSKVQVRFCRINLNEDSMIHLCHKLVSLLSIKKVFHSSVASISDIYYFGAFIIKFAKCYICEQSFWYLVIWLRHCLLNPYLISFASKTNWEICNLDVTKNNLNLSNGLKTAYLHTILLRSKIKKNTELRWKFKSESPLFMLSNGIIKW